MFKPKQQLHVKLMQVHGTSLYSTRTASNGKFAGFSVSIVNFTFAPVVAATAIIEILDYSIFWYRIENNYGLESFFFFRLQEKLRERFLSICFRGWHVPVSTDVSPLTFASNKIIIALEITQCISYISKSVMRMGKRIERVCA